MKKILFVIIFILCILPTFVFAEEKDKIDEIIEGMTTEEKIAQMIMPEFRWCDENNNIKVLDITPEIEALLKEYNFAGIIIYGQNIISTEQITRLVHDFQVANANNLNSNSQLLIAIDQEGGYVTRLTEGTIMPGNMGLTATDDPSNANEAAKIIGSELKEIGINTDFAPVVDVNNNPENPVIGVRSFSDDPDKVATYASEFMKGLQDSDIITALKHFPGHGDTSTDTHTDMTVVNKSLEELLEMELIPFQELINQNTDIIMTAHIQYPQIETQKYISKKTGEEIYLPATLSKKIITELLRNKMKYDGVVITDALDMGAIANHFDKLDTATLAINAGVDILLMPVETNGKDAIENLKNYIKSVAELVDKKTISEDMVNTAVKRILTLKYNKGLLEKYDVDIESKVASALKNVSTIENHEKEFEIAKKAVTIVKNNEDTLPLNSEDKTLILYYYTSHVNSTEYALKRLQVEGKIESTDNILFFDYEEEMNKIREEIKDAKNVIIIHAMYGLTGASSFTGTLSYNIDEVIELCKKYGTKSIFISAHLPYDISRFSEADAIVAAYLANGLSFDLIGYDTTKPIPKYGANLIATIYQLFDKNATITGKLPVNIYKLDNNYNFTEEIIYNRGYGLSYEKEVEENSNEDNIINNNTNNEIVYSGVTNIITNPTTRDNINNYIILLILNFIGIFGIRIIIIK